MAAGAPTEREKWEAECEFKRQEIELRKLELGRSRFANPVFIAVVAAAIAAAGNAYVAWTNGRSQRELEDRKSEQARIQEMIKTGDPDTAARNLQFLVEAGLVKDIETVKALQAYLKKREPGSGAALPASGGGNGIVGADDTVPLDDTSVAKPLATSAQSVGRVRQYSGNVITTQCTALHIGSGTIIAPSFCVKALGTAGQFKFVVRQNGVERLLPASVVGKPVEDPANPPFGFALLSVPALRDAPALKLTSTAPRLGDPLSIILYRLDEPRVIANAKDCRVVEVKPIAIDHLCDTGQGASGAPLLNASNEVVAIHFMRVPGGKATALRADWIAARINGPAHR